MMIITRTSEDVGRYDLTADNCCIELSVSQVRCVLLHFVLLEHYSIYTLSKSIDANGHCFLCM